jgi:hypothetical protein
LSRLPAFATGYITTEDRAKMKRLVQAQGPRAPTAR